MCQFVQVHGGMSCVCVSVCLSACVKGWKEGQDAALPYFFKSANAIQAPTLCPNDGRDGESVDHRKREVVAI